MGDGVDGFLGGLFGQQPGKPDQIGVPVLSGRKLVRVGLRELVPRRMVGKVVGGVGPDERSQVGH